MADWKPVIETSTRYVPTPRLAALYSPDAEATTCVRALVPRLVTFTGAFGMAAFVASVTRPVMLPRSDCAKQSAAAAKKMVNRNLPVMCTPLRGVLRQVAENEALPDGNENTSFSVIRASIGRIP